MGYCVPIPDKYPGQETSPAFSGVGLPQTLPPQTPGLETTACLLVAMGVDLESYFLL